MTKKQHNQAVKVQWILRTLGAREVISIGKLVKEFDVTKQTLYPHLKTLEQARYPALC